MNIIQLAKEAGVSPSTVSRALNDSPLLKEATKKRIKELASKYNYTPNALAKGLLKNQTKSIGVLVTDIRIPHYANIVHTLEGELNARGFHMFLCNTGGDFEKKNEYLSVLMRNRVDGIILVGSVYNEKYGNEHIINTAKSIPVVLVNNVIEADNIFCVYADYAEGIYAAVKFALEKGKEKFLFIARHETLSHKQKYEGFRRAIDDFPALEDSYRFFHPPAIPTHFPLENFSQLMEKLAELYEDFPFDMIIADDDAEAITIMNVLQSLGMSVPGQIGITGFNNSYLSQYSFPALTTVDIQEHFLGKESARIILSVLLDSASVIPLQKVPVYLVERNSV